MGIATWNVNSLKARFEKVSWWLERAAPDVLLMQETKLTDENAPREEFARLGYELAHHGQGRWNGVAIASKVGIRDVSVNFGEPLAPATTHDTGDDAPFAEARMIGALCGGLRVVSIYAPNGRSVASPFYQAKLAWFGRLVRFLEALPDTRDRLVLGGDFNVAPSDQDVWDPALCHGGTHVSAPERARFDEVIASGLIDAYRLRHPEPGRFSWWDYRAGAFHMNFGMRIDHLLVSAALGSRVVAAEIDREARKGKPVPSDHAPVFVDLDQPGKALDAGWGAADKRIAARRSS
jgi:exodeoxyribonuclease-3